MAVSPLPSSTELVFYSQKRRRRRICSTATGSLSTPDPTRMTSDPYKRVGMRFSSVPRLLITFLSLLLLVSAAPPCVRFADYDSINQMFIDGGPGTKVLLCPNRLYRLSGPIIFTAADQEIATYGYPTGSERAVLRVEGRNTATAIQGDCRRCARVSVKNLVVDGNRKKLGRMRDFQLATGLVVLGGNEGQSIQNSWIKNPRGFTAIHIREGDKLQCSGARVEKNEIGPVGEEYDPEKDGDDPEMSPLGRPLADGVSIACRDSFIRDNTFRDNTDAAIVVYCSPGTLIHANHIFAQSLSAMAGILMVDSTPFNGDYTGTVVRSNIIDAVSRTIRVGIGIGPTVWSDDTETILTGGSVIGNGLKGRYMGYGIAAAGLKQWTIKDNWDEAKHEGRKSARCFDEPVNPDPIGLLYNQPTMEDCTVQSGFADHDFQYLVCIDGLYDKTNPPKHDPAPLAHDPSPTNAQEDNTVQQDGDDSKSIEQPREASDIEAEPSVEKMFSTGSEMMDDVLEHSHQRMHEVIDHLSRRIDILGAASAGKGSGDSKISEVLDPAMSSHLEKLQRKIEHLEFSLRSQIETAIQLRSAIQGWDQEMALVTDWEYDILLDVRHKLELSSYPHDQPLDPRLLRGQSYLNNEAVLVDDHSHPSLEGENLRAMSDRARLNANEEAGSRASVLHVGLIGGGVIALAWVGLRWWRKRKVHGKLL
ncbi:hypothetical protein J008_06983 [Cryptococcus neoformans]|nr:hypothetical protein AYX13_04264 [Cryptococcus neoformans var. grubii]OXG09772.1 hypothetical protein C367_06951 [Cryptococcus neoformans var. grubii Ze90-1]OXG09969.1 hypothetical protein C366_06900 [Cryptococcus neoformans var. grubii Tu401-1]OXH21086.1 hypothetical protein J008_06983 [Cryptococcus neoformans var. grubii]